MLSANQIEEIKAQAYIGKPSLLPNVCRVYPFTIEEILEMGLINYNILLSLLLLTETDIAKVIKEKTGEDPDVSQIRPLEYILKSAEADDMFLLELQNAFATFVKEEVLLLPKINSVLIGPREEKRLITEKNYRDFQDILRIQNKKDFVPPPPSDETPGERKMRLLREQVAAVKKKQAQKKGSNQTLDEIMSIAETYGINPKTHTLYAFYSLLRRHQLKEKWEQDLQVICAGADSQNIKTKYWGESPDEE